MHALATSLPWTALLLVLLAFAGADAPASSGPGRFLAAATSVFLALAAILVAVAPGVTSTNPLLLGAGPLGLVLFARGLRRGFRSWKGREPTLVFGAGAAREAAALPGRGWDFVYSMLVGMGMLLAAAPALAEIIATGTPD